jgi:hypothetical protein
VKVKFQCRSAMYTHYSLYGRKTFISFGTDLQIDAIMFHGKDFNYDEFYFLDENGFNFESHDDIFLKERIM